VFGNETPVAAVGREQCREFLNLLLRLPAHADQRYRGLSIRQAVEAAEGKKVRLICAANVNAHLIRFGATMNWALNEGYIERNPARSLQVPDPVARSDKRNPFSNRQLQAIFDAPIYTGCEDDGSGYAKPGSARPRRARFWVSLIALFSGMRLNEICQLDTNDIVDVEGVLCFRISASSASAKRIKSAASERIVPIHPELKRIGLTGFVAERRAAQELKLFPELPVSSLGYHSVSFSRWFSRFLEVSGAAVEKTCFHSFRHNFRDGLRDARVPREIALLLGGWSSTAGASAAADVYGSGFKSQQLEEELAKVSFPFLDLSHL
jgi:integrase